MKPPPLLLGATALFWGWQTGLIIPGILVAIAMEGRFLSTSRLAFSLREYRMIWNLSALIALASFAFSLSEGIHTGMFLSLFQWVPLMFLPIAAAQVYGDREKIDVAIFSFFMRNAKSRGPGDDPPAVNIEYPYLVLMIASTSAANVRSIWFYAFVGICAFWILWSIRPKSFPAHVWIPLFVFILASGYSGSVGLQRLQEKVEENLIDLYTKMFLNQPDPFTTSTSIGEIGRLKDSGTIVYRVENDKGYQTPTYLPISSYNIFRLGSWYAMKAPLMGMFSESSGLDWKFAEPTGNPSRLAVHTYLPSGEGLLAIPLQTHRLERLPANKMFANRLGTVKVGGAPGYVKYILRMGDSVSRISPPDENDLVTPKVEERGISLMVNQLELKGKAPGEVLRIVDNHFQDNFTYSLDLKSAAGTKLPGGPAMADFFRKGDTTAIEDFLFNTRSGHCEYFATATTLILRQAGIPTRYFVGYLAHEHSFLENAYIVRSRDAHAWPMVYVDGKWSIFDTTPGSWTDEDMEDGSFFERPFDLLSFLYLQFSKWRWGEESALNAKNLAPILMLLILFLVYRIISSTKVRREDEQVVVPEQAGTIPGDSSAYYLVEKRLNELGFNRGEWETQAEFISRLKSEQPLFPKEDTLALLDMHYRLRFDPKGLTDLELDAMMDKTMKWILKSESMILEGSGKGEME
ncbi:MAG: transglutaminase domain-containing protein [Nitrospinota bacterium]|nr:transglutaminase domain-containing protein [Nitrospinota bacterium]